VPRLNACARTGTGRLSQLETRDDHDRPGLPNRHYLERSTSRREAAVLRRERPTHCSRHGRRHRPETCPASRGSGDHRRARHRVIGARLEAISGRGPRALQATARRGLKDAVSRHRTSPEDLTGVSLPAVVRPAFTLGGHAAASPTTPSKRARGRARYQGIGDRQGLVEDPCAAGTRSSGGGAATRPNRRARSSIENSTRWACNTGESVTVRAADDAERRRPTTSCATRAIRGIRAVGVETGGSKHPVARPPLRCDPRDRDDQRVSRSFGAA